MNRLNCARYARRGDLGRKRNANNWGGDFEVAHVLFVAVRRRHTEREGFRHAGMLPPSEAGCECVS